MAARLADKATFVTGAASGIGRETARLITREGATVFLGDIDRERGDCNSPWTLEFFERLYAATERYRIPVLLASALPAGREIQAEHGALAQATLDRDFGKASALLEQHYLRTVDDLAEVIRSHEGLPIPVTLAG